MTATVIINILFDCYELNIYPSVFSRSVGCLEDGGAVEPVLRATNSRQQIVDFSFLQSTLGTTADVTVKSELGSESEQYS